MEIIENLIRFSMKLQFSSLYNKSLGAEGIIIFIGTSITAKMYYDYEKNYDTCHHFSLLVKR